MNYVKILISSFLIAGTSIGAGILGMPVEAGESGFLPSVVFLTITWLVTLITGLLFIEAILYGKKDANFFSLSGQILGSSAKTTFFFIYLFLFYSLIVAYVKGGGVFIHDLLEGPSSSLGSLIFLLAFTPFVFLKTKILGGVNAILTFGLAVSFCILVSLGIQKVEPDLLTKKDWGKGSLAIPLFLTSFGFHSVLPSVANYLKRDRKQLRLVVFIGSILTFCVYFIWLYLVLGIVPLEGEHGLLSAHLSDQTAITPLKYFLKSTSLSYAAQVFYFTALSTSFLGVSLGLIDFLRDVMSLKKSSIHKLILCLFVYVPAFFLSLTDIRVFYLSLRYGAGIACALLLILLPGLLVRKVSKNSDLKKSFLQKPVILSVVFGFFIIVCITELFHFVK